MKAIKRNFENLQKVCDSITKVNYSQGSFVVDYISGSFDTITLFADGRDSIGTTILSKIPSNYSFHMTFEDGGIRLTIWFEK